MKTPDLIWRLMLHAVGLFFIPILANAQDELPEDLSVNIAYDKMNVATPPETWMFMKYGGQRPSLYTGTVNSDIPIYTYKDNDFEIPITLSYASNGLVPNTQASTVGLGWMLQAGGGFIMLEVNGVPDDGGSGNISGYSSYIKNMPPLDRPLMSRIYMWADKLLPVMSSDPDNDKAAPYYETTPDIYTFNFCGHYGKFLTTHSGTHIYNTSSPSGEYKIDFLRDGIIITTGDGYKYKFQNSDEVSTCTNTLSNQRSYSNDRKFNLRQIIAPNGRKVEFSYILDNYENRRGVGFSNKFYEGETSGFWYIRGESLARTNSLPPIGEFLYYPYIVGNSGKISLISSITIDTHTKIEFEYSTRKYQEEGWSSEAASTTDPGALHKNSYGFTTLATPQKLDGIKVFSRIGNGNLYCLKNCSFEYNYGVSSGNQIMMLNNAFLSGIGTYEMEYYNSGNPFPYHGTPAIDHWGYFNGQESNNLSTAVPDPYLDGETACFRSASRDPHSKFAIQGMLKKLVYPTGGYSLFNYEDHSFSQTTEDEQYLSKNFNSKDYKIDSNTWRTGGLRIKNITDYSTSGLKLKWTDYAYTDFVGNNSGVLTYFPIYIHKYFIPGWGSVSTIKKAAPQYNQIDREVDEIMGYSSSRSHIEYSSVREISSDGAYTIYSFSNSTSISVPDDEVPGDYFEKIVTDNVPQITLPISLEAQRGKLVYLEQYDNAGSLISRTENQYDYSKELSHVVQAKEAPVNAYEHWIYTDDYPLEKTITTKFAGGKSISSTEIYDYNTRNQISQSTTVDSKQDTIRIRKIYAYEMASGVLKDSILHQNLLKLPGETIKTIRGTQVIDASLHAYKLESGRVVPESVAEATNLPVSIMARPTYSTKTSYDVYDNFGNIVQTTDNTGKITSYIWGYGGMYVLAKIEGITINEVINRGFPTLLTQLIPEGLSTAQKQAASWWGRTTLYEYAPLIGVTKITDPYRISTSYTYNNDHKLYQVKDHDGNILKQYNYSTDNQ